MYSNFIDFNSTFTYVWDYHGAWHLGSEVLIRCLPGYVLPNSLANVSYSSYSCPKIAEKIEELFSRGRLAQGKNVSFVSINFGVQFGN